MKTCLGIPVVGSVSGSVYHTHLNLAVSMGRVCETVVLPRVVDVLPHGRAREEILAQAFKFDCDYLFFLDSDMEPPIDSFSVLLRCLKETGAQMVSAHCYRRGYPYTCIWTRLVGEEGHQIDGGVEARPEEIDSTGLAANLIDLRWLRKNVQAPFFEMDKLWEDYSFCQKMKKAGGKIFACPQVRVGHLGDPTIINDSTADRLRREYLLRTIPVT